MNVLQYLISNARCDASTLRASHMPASSEIDRGALREAKELDAAADLAEHSLRALGLIASPAQRDDGA
jgi:hypothetical protein